MHQEQLQIFYNLETSLHKKEIRNSKEKVSKLIADDFVEFGKSGGIFSKQDILNELENEAVDLQIAVSDLFVRELSPNVVLVTYTASMLDSDHATTVSTNRSSIWVLREGKWQVTFHQGTKKQGQMTNAIILHGTGDKPTDFWFPYLKEKLEERGIDVWLPQLPNARTPNLRDWLSFVLEHGTFTEDTILVGHSSGAQLILSILSKLQTPIKQAILVSGYTKELRATPEDPMNAKDFAWDEIRNKSKQFIFINSDNDPWTCDDKQGRIMFDHLGGMQIILHGEGHMGSTTYNQPYKEFPLLLKLIL